MLGRRRRRQYNIKATFGQCLVFAGKNIVIFERGEEFRAIRFSFHEDNTS